ncbi:MAG: non-canonical purine NTP pyrophosphatase [Planctomycetia bacterium]|nr:non-canonical purine NTP pyrophosphatase [Planctomycetia bacterium]
MSQRPYVVFGTSNRNKAIEATRVVAASGVVLRPLSDFPNAIDVVEDGQTFADNARKKAIEQALCLHEWTLAEDSGVCVNYLDGAPGVHSARFAGEDPRDDKRNNQKLIELLQGVPLEKRNAHYACHMTLVDPNGTIVFDVEEYCRGRILLQEHGQNGFGYDPLFEIVEYHRTFGELSPSIKAVISHRARATRRLAPVLVQLARQNVLPLF